MVDFFSIELTKLSVGGSFILASLFFLISFKISTANGVVTTVGFILPFSFSSLFSITAFAAKVKDVFFLTTSDITSDVILGVTSDFTSDVTLDVTFGVNKVSFSCQFFMFFFFYVFLYYFNWFWISNRLFKR